MKFEYNKKHIEFINILDKYNMFLVYSSKTKRVRIHFGPIILKSDERIIDKANIYIASNQRFHFRLVLVFLFDTKTVDDFFNKILSKLEYQSNKVPIFELEKIANESLPLKKKVDIDMLDFAMHIYRGWCNMSTGFMTI